MRTDSIDTPWGTARVHLDEPEGQPRLLLVLGHSAGGGIDAPDLRAVRDAALRLGAAVARVEQPYRVAGRRAPAPAGHLDEAWASVVARLRAMPAYGPVPLVAGGRSSGGRVACRTARQVGAAAVVALAFPLRPPWRPGASRADELADAGVPVLVVSGESDPFGVPDPGDLGGDLTVHTLAGEAHDLSRDPVAVGEVVARWLGRVR